jgi:hypothetical protein
MNDCPRQNPAYGAGFLTSYYPLSPCFKRVLEAFF